ncbi:hypothetical protein BH23GEM7_BH23GEM7_38230 [soil metagenome]
MQITARNRHATASALSLPSSAQGSDTGRGMLVCGHVLSTFVALFLFFDGGARLVRFAPYVEGTVKFGYADHLASWIGLVLILSTLLYVIPRTAVLGAILLTGYLGGATASQLRGRPVVPLPRRLRGSGLGRALPARRPAARAHPAATLSGRR